MTPILIIPGTIMLLCIVALFRNNAVYNFRCEVIELVYNHADWIRRREEFHKVSYNDMVLKFWKPLTIEAWYDTNIIK